MTMTNEQKLHACPRAALRYSCDGFSRPSSDGRMFTCVVYCDDHLFAVAYGGGQTDAYDNARRIAALLNTTTARYRELPKES